MKHLVLKPHAGMASSFRWPSRGFLAGLALATPFVASPLPAPIASLLVAPLLLDLLVRGIRLRPLLRPAPIVIIIGCFAALHLGALAIGSTPFPYDVLKNLVWSGGAVGIVLLASAEIDRPEQIIPGFLGIMALTAIPIAIAGLVKYWLQLHGILFGSMINSCYGRYPQGTTFCGDYNLFALYLGVAAIAVSWLLLHRSNGKCATVILSVGLAIVFTADVYAGSRRFIALAAIIGTYWGVHAIFSPYRVFRAAMIPLIIGTALTFYFGLPRDKIADEEAVTVAQIFADLLNLPKQPSPVELLRMKALLDGTAGPASIDENGNPRLLAARDVSPLAMATTFNNSFGFESRVDKLRLGWELVKENGYFLGRGFSYHKIFSCKFVECRFIDYPHAPILSAWIGFGVLGLLLAIAFYAVTAINIWTSGKYGLSSGTTMVVLATLPYSAISGDTILSLPHIIGAAMMASVSAGIIRYRIQILDTTSPSCKP